MTHYPAVVELTRNRLREFYREPEAVFWVYGFPILLTVLLGIAFRNRPVEQLPVDVVRSDGAEAVVASVKDHPELIMEIHPLDQCRERLRLGRSTIVVIPGEPLEYLFDPTRPESATARLKVDEALQIAAGRKNAFDVTNQEITEPGARYIDFLVPGLLGMNLMMGGLFGVGFVTVDMRARKLLKRFVATPMNKGDFLLALMVSRMSFMVPEVILILLAAWMTFGVAVEGGAVAILLVCLIGAVAFAGLGLLIASRAQKLETVSGLMNLVMLPMWLFSGIFFSSERFPDLMQPFVQALPLTQLNNVLRAVITEGASLTTQWLPLLALMVWGVVSFILALKWFRWT